MQEYPSNPMFSENIDKIAQAIVKVMTEVGAIEKNSEVGAGTNFAYKGVRDVDVKARLLPLMAKNGLSVAPIDIDSELNVERWEEAGYQGKVKQKTQIFLRAKTKYLLMHTSGQWITFVGEGHGIDTGDKAAGKATTYALKYALLYLFMIPVGHIDDADTDASPDPEEYRQTPSKRLPAKAKPGTPPPPKKSTVAAPTKMSVKETQESSEDKKDDRWDLEVGDEKWEKVMNYVNKQSDRGMHFIMRELEKYYNIKPEILSKFKEIVTNE